MRLVVLHGNRSRRFVGMLQLAMACLAIVASLSSCGPAEAPGDPALFAMEGAAAPPSAIPPPDEETLEALEALGYLSGYDQRPERTGTTRHDPARAQPGYNLFISGHAPAAYLVDMDGALVHMWSYDARTLYPVAESRDYWRRVHLADNGDLYALVDPHGIIKLTVDSQLVWHTDGSELLHHDLFVADSGMVYAIGRRVGPIAEIHAETDILDDTVVVFDANGKKVDSFSIYDAFRDTEWSQEISDRVRQVLQLADPDSRVPMEAFHTNTIEVFDGTLSSISPLLGPGHAVLCSPIHQNVFIVNLTSKRVVWNWFGPWERGIHQPTFLTNGNWLLFDNGVRFEGSNDAASGVFEYTFPGLETAWEYTGDAENGEFYSRFSSLADRLPNGNTMIVVSNEGRAIEVTPEKEIVWEFYNPYSVDVEMRGRQGFAARENGEVIGTLFQLERVPAHVHDQWLKRDRP